MTNMNERFDKNVSIIDEDIDRGPKSVLVKGVLSGSFITVVVLAISCGVVAAMGQWHQGMTWCASAIAAGLLGGILQQVWFSYSVLTRPSYPVRIAGFGFSYFAVLVCCAILGKWLPIERLGAWASFTITYLVILAVVTAAYAIAYRRQGASYSERLEAYRKRRNG